MPTIWQNNVMTLAIGTALKHKGMTQAALADKVEVSRGFMSEIISGKKTPSLETLQKIATALGVSPAELYKVSPRGMAEAGEAYHSEASASPYSQVSAKLTGAIHALAPSAKHPQTFRVDKTQLGFALTEGDVLVVDINDQPKDGDLVITTTTDMDTGEGVTNIRRWLSPWLIPSDITDKAVKLSDDGAVAIMGVIKAVLRADAL